MNVKRLIVAGIVASVLFLVLDAALGMAGGLIGARVFGLPAEQPPGFEASSWPMISSLPGARFHAPDRRRRKT